MAPVLEIPGQVVPDQAIRTATCAGTHAGQGGQVPSAKIPLEMRQLTMKNGEFTKEHVEWTKKNGNFTK